jgi:hypothetical protein
MTATAPNPTSADSDDGGRSLVRYARPDLERMSTAIISDRADGATLGELSDRHGISIWAVRQVLSAAGMTGRSRVPGAGAALGARPSSPSPAAYISAGYLPARGERLSPPAAPAAPAAARVSALGHLPLSSHRLDASIGSESMALEARATHPTAAASSSASVSASSILDADADLLGSRRPLTPAEVRRLRGVRALTVRSNGSAAGSDRLAALVSGYWGEGVGLADLADALGISRDGVVSLLRRAGVTDRLG